MLTRRLGLVMSLCAALLTTLGVGVAYADQEVQVALTEFKIEPSTFSVKPGDKVRFVVTNSGQFPHDIHIEGQGVTAEIVEGATGNIQKGRTATFEITFEKAGTYQIWCPVGQHRQRGMEGTLTVAAATAAPAAMQLPRTGGPSLALLALAGAMLTGAGLGVCRWRR